jgi:hypothetical protein
VNAAMMNRLLRSPSEVAQDCREDRVPPRAAAHAIAAILIGGLLFGAAVGSWRGGPQIAFAALKLPLVTLGTLVLSVPAFYAIAAIFGRPGALRGAVSIMLVAGARFSLVLLAATPVVWLTVNLGASYDAVRLLAALAYAMGGLAALGIILRALVPGPWRLVTVVTFVGVFLLVGAQTAWILRPYLGTPGNAEITLFTRKHEGGLAYQLYLSLSRMLTGKRARSAAGAPDRTPEAPDTAPEAPDTAPEAPATAPGGGAR